MRAIFAIALVTLAVCSSDGAQLAFSARNLPNMDPFNGAPDAYIDVYYAPNPQTQWLKIGSTADISDDHNPNWPELFTFSYNGGNGQRLLIDVYDADWPDANDFIGKLEFTLSEVVNAFGGIITRDLQEGERQGQLIVRLASPKDGEVHTE